MKQLSLGLAVLSALVVTLIMASEVQAQDRTDLPAQVSGTGQAQLYTNTTLTGFVPNDCIGCPSEGPLLPVYGMPNPNTMPMQNYPYYNPYYQNLYYPYAMAPQYPMTNLYYNYNYYNPYYSNLLYQPSYPGYVASPYGQQYSGNYLGIYDQTRSHYNVQRDANNNAYYVPKTGTITTTGSSSGTQQANGTSVTVIQ